MQATYQTPRLTLTELTISDAIFILELINTPEWIQFIGDRNIRTYEGAIGYIEKIIANLNITYWVVKTHQQTSIGVITFIQRDYLPHPDFGFAFLSTHTKKGYAYRAAMAVLNDVKKDINYIQILAITLIENINSIQLLKKLGFTFNKEIIHDSEALQVYAIT